MHMEWSLLLWNFVAVTGFMSAVWALSVVIKNASIADTFWGLGFVLVAWITFLGAEGYLGRRLLITLLVTAWGLRLAQVLVGQPLHRFFAPGSSAVGHLLGRSGRPVVAEAGPVGLD